MVKEGVYPHPEVYPQHKDRQPFPFGNKALPGSLGISRLFQTVATWLHTTTERGPGNGRHPGGKHPVLAATQNSG